MDAAGRENFASGGEMEVFSQGSGMGGAEGGQVRK